MVGATGIEPVAPAMSRLRSRLFQRLLAIASIGETSVYQ